MLLLNIKHIFKQTKLNAIFWNFRNSGISTEFTTMCFLKAVSSTTCVLWDGQIMFRKRVYTAEGTTFVMKPAVETYKHIISTCLIVVNSHLF